MSVTRKTLILLYALFYAWLAWGMTKGSVSAEYPWPYVLMSMIAQVLVTVGIVLSTFDDPRPYDEVWRRVFPLLVAELAIEVISDAVVPANFNLASHGGAWVTNMLLVLALAAPAYYFNYRLGWPQRRP